MKKIIKEIFQDENLIVLDKPTGLVVNRSKTTKDTLTLQDHIEKIYPDILNYDDYEFNSRSGLLHRLDKPTSGVILVAKNPDTFYKIKDQFVKRHVKKEYRAILLGKLPNNKLIEVNAPIKRDTKNRIKFCVSSGGRDAKTTFEKINETKYNDMTLTYVKAFPKTGRTHQIRVHSVAMSAPILGDSLYSSRHQKTWAYENNFSRLYLHALQIGIYYPSESKELNFFSSQLPEEFSNIFE